MGINMQIDMPARIYLADLVEILNVQCSFNELFEFIKEIDYLAADLNLTKQLRDYFVSEVEKEESQNEA